MGKADTLVDRTRTINGGRIFASKPLAGRRESTGRHYLEDIFVFYVKPGLETV